MHPNKNVRDIIFYPDRRLMTKSAEVKEVTDVERKEFEDLHAAAMHYEGIGLAGVQIAIMKQLFVVEHDYIVKSRKLDRPLIGQPLFMANTVILEKSEELQENEEGCLSLPGIRTKVIRPKKIKASYIDRNNQKQEIEAEDLLAACIQHELDHTLGKTILDYQTPLSRHMLIKKIDKAVKLIREDEEYSDSRF